tara:strand:- start:3 stop:770 length:768 start_codon:yes stop_codon:yes gene_type:complete
MTLPSKPATVVTATVVTATVLAIAIAVAWVLSRNERFTATMLQQGNILTTSNTGEIDLLSVADLNTTLQTMVDQAKGDMATEIAAVDTKVNTANDDHHQFRRETNFKGGTNEWNAGTHFPHTDGNNYIRGPVNFQGGDLRIGQNNEKIVFSELQLTRDVLVSMMTPVFLWRDDAKHNNGVTAVLSQGEYNFDELLKRGISHLTSQIFTGSFKVQVYKGKNYDGEKKIIEPQTTLFLRELAHFNDRIMSIRVLFPW